MVMQSPPKNPTLAAILSFLINGVGQIYNGEIVKGIIIIVVQIVNALLMTIVIGFITWPIVWIWSIYDAYKVAQRINEEAAQQVVVTIKVCPRCAERVNSGARICHFCNYEFMPDGAPLQELRMLPPSSPVFPAAQPQLAMPVPPDPVPVAAPQSAAQPTVKYCPKCGAQAAATANFCLQCGNRFEAAPMAPAMAGEAVAGAPLAGVPAVEETLEPPLSSEPVWSEPVTSGQVVQSDGTDVMAEATMAPLTPAYDDDSPLSSLVDSAVDDILAPEELT